MRNIVPLIPVTLLLALWVGCSSEKPTAAKAGDLDVQLRINPDPPTTGENKLHVAVRDASGKPVGGAKLGFEYFMPAMGAMPEMKGSGEVQSEGSGRYVVSYQLPMQGDWRLTLGINAESHPPAVMKLKVSPPRNGFTVEGTKSEGATKVGGKVIDLPFERQQLIGVSFGTVEERPLAVTLRAAGVVAVDERQLADVTLKYEAYVEKLLVGETGKTVRAGQPLLTLYSPDLLSAEEELLTARKSGAAPEIANAAAKRLSYWDLRRDQIAELEKRGKADGRVTISSPASGVILEKAIVEGAHVMPGNNLYRIGNLGRVWVQASVFERDALLISVGQQATVTLPAVPGETIDARVSFVAPTVDEKTRTLEARLELLNPKLLLRPGMFADVVIRVALGTRLSIPDSSLLMSGLHRYAFVDQGEGKLQPVEVEVGLFAGEYDEVKSGLRKGDRVATNATFLLSSEAKLQDALPHWSAP